MEMQKTTIRWYEWLPLIVVLYHFYIYRYWEIETRKWFFVSLYGWAYALSLVKLKESKDAVRTFIYGFSASAAFNFVLIEIFGQPYNEWGRNNWIAMIIGILHPIVIFVYYKVKYKDWFLRLSIIFLYIKEKFIISLCNLIKTLKHQKWKQ